MEVFNLNIIPGAVAPIIHASQYDEEREFRANLFEGDQVFELTGEETISVNVRKPDGNVVTAAVVNTGSNYVEFSTTLQMTACAGANLCQLRIENSPRKIGTLNFILAVERDPLEGGIQSESEIHNLETQVAGMVAEDVATQYDSANVIFDNEPTDNHGIGYTVTSEGIKTAIDNAFDYDNTASGSLVHITDGADNIPVKSLVSQIVAVERGNGQPKSPSNPYSISGFDSGVVTRCGKNLFSYDLTIRDGYWSNDAFVGTNAIVPKENALSWQYIRIYVKGLFSITLSGFDNQGGTNCAWLGSENVDDVISRFNSLNKNGTKTVPSGAKYLCLTIYNIKERATTYPNAQLEISDTATTYEAYNGNAYTFTFGQTVYGGHFDNKGNLVVTYAITDINTAISSRTTSYANPVFYGSISGLKPQSNNSLCECFNTINGQASASNFANISNNHDFAINSLNSGDTVQVFLRADEYTDVASLKSACGNSKIIYELANPIILAITSQDIPTLLGENNIFSNCGDVEVTYYTYKSNDILEFVDSEIGKKNGTNIPIEENSQDSIKDYVDNEVSTINTSLADKADTNSVYAKTESFYCPQSHDFESGTTSSDAIIWFINTYGTKPMSFGFVITGLGWFECFLTFYSDSQGGGILLLNGSSRLWAVTYINGVITLTEK